MKPIPNCVPCLTGNEAKYLQECVDTGWVSPVGPFVDRFEEMFAQYHRVPKAASVNSGTAALHLALIAVGVKPNDLVLCPTMTFIGTVNPIRYCGADPVLIDCEPQTLNLDVNVFADFLRSETDRRRDGLYHRITGRRVPAVVVVHLYGNPADMDVFCSLADEYGLVVIEDAAESLGAFYKGQRVGLIGEVGCFSFNGNKVITTGGGGMIISQKPEVTSRCKHLSTTARSDTYDFIHDDVGYNYRLSNLCAAVGVAQMQHLDEFVALKRQHATAYATGFARKGRWRVIMEPADAFGTYWMAVAQPTDRKAPSTFEDVKCWARAGLGVRPIWHPIHKMAPFRDAIYFGGETATTAHQECFCLPSSVGLTEEQIEDTLKILHS